MPKALFDFLGYAIYFWIGDEDEPIHVHVSKGHPHPNATKIWMTADGTELAHNNSKIPDHDLRRIEKYIQQCRNTIIGTWITRFGKGELKS